MNIGMLGIPDMARKGGPPSSSKRESKIGIGTGFARIH